MIVDRVDRGVYDDLMDIEWDLADKYTALHDGVSWEFLVIEA